jgi:hypothetical protein
MGPGAIDVAAVPHQGQRAVGLQIAGFMNIAQIGGDYVA